MASANVSAAHAALRLVVKYWRRPAIWPIIAGLIGTFAYRRLCPGAADRDARQREEERLRAEDWCAQRALSLDRLASALPFEFEPVDPADLYPELFQEAEARVADCPVKLGGAGNLTLLFALAKSCRARRVVETGVAYGWSSLALLLAIREREGAALYSVDLPYLALHNDEWVGIAVPPELHSLWRLYRTADRQGLPRAIEAAGEIDLAHYDSDKSARGRAFGYAALWDALRPGGILVSDDVGDNLAFRDFGECVGRAPVVVRQDRKYQGVLIK